MYKELSFRFSNDRSKCGVMAMLAVKKLLSSAALLPEGEYLGWQIRIGPGGLHDGVAFVSDGAGASEEDLDWIYETCTGSSDDAQDTADDAANRLDSFCGSGRKVYLFRENEAAGVNKRRQAHDNGARIFEEFLVLTKEMEADIRFIVGPDGGSGKACGMMLLSLPEEITLRMRSLLSLSFPYLTICRIDTIPERPEETQKLSGSIAHACLKDMLPPLLYINEKEIPYGNIVGTEDEAYDSGEFTPIEVKNSGDTRPDGKDNLMTLEELVGLKEVKQQIRRIMALAKMKQAMPEGTEVPIVLNMEFVGNPGTAKTTVARILAGVLADIGILSSREMIEVGRADLVAGYVGQTAEQVKNIFQRARGKLLFIDEAYAVADHENGRFGEEAINTLVLEMENHREDTIVVMAGYPDKMERFFSTNPGLRSRVPFKITFPDYSADELVQIAQMEAGRRGFAIHPDAEERLLACCETAAGNDNAGNGRFCRNLVEDSILNYAERVYGKETVPDEADFSLASEDFAIPNVLQEEKKKEERTIGFRCS